jgi:AraC-like DNA-binding protein
VISAAVEGLFGGSVHDHLERYTAEELLAPTVQLSVMRHEVHQVDVHWHDFYELVHVTGGTAVHRLNGSPQQLVPGSTFLLTPADFHEISTESDEPLSYYNVVVDAALLEGQTAAPLPIALERTARVLSDAADLGADFQRLWEESTVRRPGALAMMEAILRCILIELARRSGGAAHGGPERSLREQADIHKAVLYVDRHFREPLSLGGVAAQVHLSPNYFSERFREFTGTSFQTYLQHRRLAFAHSLLAATGLGVTEVCRAAGFNSLSHFGRAYRARYGSSPTAFRTLSDRRAAATAGTSRP